MRFGPFEILQELGKGGTTRVDRARDLRPEAERPGPEEVALKRPLGVLTAEEKEKRVKDIRNEAQAGLRLRHPHLVAIYEAGEAEGVPYCTLQMVYGPTLRRILQRARGKGGDRGWLSTGIPADLALDWLASSADALHWASLQVAGFIHRDLKPENLLVDWDGCIRVADYGLARFTHREDLASSDDFEVVRGTPCYMAPEQARGESLDARSDVYALGLVALELFTGFQRIPEGFGSSGDEALRAADSANPNTALGLMAHRFPDLASLVASMLRRVKEDRPGMDKVRVRLGTLLHRMGGATGARSRHPLLLQLCQERPPPSGETRG